MADTFQPQRGRRPVLQNCLLDELAVDSAYQRSIDGGSSRTLVRRIAREWDWALCQPLVVAQRPDRRLFVVDGQHRLAAARLRRDIRDLPCVIHAYESAADEAQHFVALNQERRPLSALDLFKAALASGDADARSVMRLLARAGLQLAPNTNHTTWEPGQVSNIGGILRCHQRQGEQLTARALRVLADGFRGDVLRYAGTLFSGIVALLAELEDAADDQLATLVLAGATQAEWMKDIAVLEAERGVHRSVAAGLALRQAYIEALAEEREEAA